MLKKRIRRIVMSNRQEKNLSNLGHGALYRVLSTIAYVGVFAAVGILVVSLTSGWTLNEYLWGAIATIAILSLGIISSLPWIRRIEKKEYRVASIVFTLFIAACVVLWAICLWLAVVMISSRDGSNAVWFAQFLRIAIIVSLQLMVSTFVGNVLIKCGKTMVFIQVISYLSYLFVDFWLSTLALCIVINPNSATAPIAINDSVGFLFKPVMITIFVLALVYALISKFIMRSIEGRRVKAMTEEMVLQMDKKAEPVEHKDSTQKTQGSIEEKLAKLKELYDKNLITEEDYNKKRDDILKNL